jgi:hypothetical protein
MFVDMEITGGLHAEVQPSMSGDVGEHMIEKSHARPDVVQPRPVESEVELDACLGGRPADL